MNEDNTRTRGGLRPPARPPATRTPAGLHPVKPRGPHPANPGGPHPANCPAARLHLRASAFGISPGSGVADERVPECGRIGR